MPKNTSRCPDGPDEMKTLAESKEKRRVDPDDPDENTSRCRKEKDLDPDGKD